MTRDDDSFFETPRFKKRANWVVAVFCVLTVVVVALPLIAVFTNWL
jgi:hypothetical protein